MADGSTLVPWQSGRSVTWDVTVAHTLATFYVSQNALQAGSAAAAASTKKRPTTKYSTLSATHMFFFLVAVETLGPLSDEAHTLIAEARFAQPIHGETTFLYQCISVAIQRFKLSTQCTLPIRSQFPSPHRNHSRHTFLHLLILRPRE